MDERIHVSQQLVDESQPEAQAREFAQVGADTDQADEAETAQNYAAARDTNSSEYAAALRANAEEYAAAVRANSRDYAAAVKANSGDYAANQDTTVHAFKASQVAKVQAPQLEPGNSELQQMPSHESGAAFHGLLKAVLRRRSR